MRKSSVVIALGVLVFVLALAQPATTTETVETCYDDPWTYGQECSTSTVETPNPVRGQLFGLSVVLLVVGVVARLVSGSTSGETPARSESPPQRTGADSGPERRRDASTAAAAQSTPQSTRKQGGQSRAEPGPGGDTSAETGQSAAGQTRATQAAGTAGGAGQQLGRGQPVQVTIDGSRQHALDVVRLALERTALISEYYVSPFQVVAKTGVSFPRVLWSYGETLYVDVHETDDPDTTRVTVSGEKEVAINVGSDPEKVKRAFLGHLDEVRALSATELDRELSDLQRSPPASASGDRRGEGGRHGQPVQASKEVTSERDLSSGSSVLQKVVLAILVIFVLFVFLSLAAV